MRALAIQAAREDDEAERARLAASKSPPLAQPVKPDPDEPLLVTLNRAATLLGVCRQTLYRMSSAGEITFRKIRGRTLVPMAEVRRLVGEAATKAGPAEEPKLADPPKRRPKKVKLIPRGQR
ncbi:helix-turn-helix domain-containing protein [Hyphomicrobium nitrativorans]|uniref:helix-turn-helix domain-containing protein n=1 Tax=Hyphomicrobium nitrativorans TaxID=1427356 RepID=UPI00130D6802|nr:helix-turn-helix domain-containing protein [Hyphomicrobium nitrativorans]